MVHDKVKRPNTSVRTPNHTAPFFAEDTISRDCAAISCDIRSAFVTSVFNISDCSPKKKRNEKQKVRVPS